MTGNEPPFDDELLAIATDLLREADFAIQRRVSEQKREQLFADSPYFVVAITSVASLPDIGPAEAELTEDLLRIAEQRELGPRRWDLYSVILCGSDVQQGDSVAILFELTYDTKYVRRIVRVGVKPTLAGLREALRTFLPIRPVHSDVPLSDPLVELQAALAEEGVAEDEAGRAIAAFRSRGSHGNA